MAGESEEEMNRIWSYDEIFEGLGKFRSIIIYDDKIDYKYKYKYKIK